MKKILRLTAAVATLALALSVTACSKPKEPTDDTPENAAQSNDSASISGYESEKYNLKFTPPEGYVMYSDAELAAQSGSTSPTNYEMISEHSSGFPNVTVITESSNAKTAEEYLEILKANLEGEGNTATETTDTEIAGRPFKTFTLSMANGIVDSFYAEKTGNEFLCIAIITYDEISNADENEVISAFSSLN